MKIPTVLRPARYLKNVTSIRSSLNYILEKKGRIKKKIQKDSSLSELKIKSGMFFVIFIWIWTDVLKILEKKEIFLFVWFFGFQKLTHYNYYYYYYSKSYTTIPQIRAEYYLVFWKRIVPHTTQIMKKRKKQRLSACYYLSSHFFLLQIYFCFIEWISQ